MQKEISEKFGDAVWSAPAKALHITLFDWLAPLVDYGKDKDELFKQIFPEYDRVVSQALKTAGPIAVTFMAVKVAPAAIFIVGHDNGQFEQIRNYFLDNVELLPDTKRPPTIIHSTIARFTKEIELEEIEQFIENLTVSFTETIDTFRLIKETVDPLLEFEVIKEYKLGI